ncbi:hypothetical protein [Rhodococcus sp. IEGM1428]|uniref:hypothetical protein n=1 Tax=Rhodococcus sp. IEGM1428 TaxID=3392191 RepID=UPI003D121CE7
MNVLQIPAQPLGIRPGGVGQQPRGSLGRSCYRLDHGGLDVLATQPRHQVLESRVRVYLTENPGTPFLVLGRQVALEQLGYEGLDTRSDIRTQCVYEVHAHPGGPDRMISRFFERENFLDRIDRVDAGQEVIAVASVVAVDGLRPRDVRSNPLVLGREQERRQQIAPDSRATLRCEPVHRVRIVVGGEGSQRRAHPARRISEHDIAKVVGISHAE